MQQPEKLELERKGRRSLRTMVLPIAAASAAIMFSGATPAFADGTIFISSQDETQFQAYRLLTGNAELTASWQFDEAVASPAIWNDLAGAENAQNAGLVARWIEEQEKISAQKVATNIGNKFKPPEAHPTQIIAANTAVQMPAGYYVITSNVAGNIPFLVKLHDGDNLDLAAKPSKPTLSKEVKNANGSWGSNMEISAGELLDFRLLTVIPAGYDSYDEYSYDIVDKLTDGLDFITDSFHASVTNDTDGSRNVDNAVDVQIDGRTATFVFGNLKERIPDLKPGDTIEIDYKVSVNNGATRGAIANVNTAYAEYSTGSGSGTTETQNTESYVYNLNIIKKSGDGEKLSGAKFILLDSAGMYMTKDGWSDNKENALVLESNADGKISIDGIPSGKFSLDEIEAPEGYEKLSNPVTITISSTLSAAGLVALDAKVAPKDPAEIEKVDVNSGDITISVKNDKSIFPPVPVNPSNNENNENNANHHRNNNNNNNTTSNNHNTKTNNSNIPKLGENAIFVGGCVIIVIAAVSVAVVMLRRRKDDETETENVVPNRTEE